MLILRWYRDYATLDVYFGMSWFGVFIDLVDVGWGYYLIVKLVAVSVRLIFWLELSDGVT